MHKLQATNLFLMALRQYEPEAYLEEVSEIFNCIMENNAYDNAPDLNQRELIIILESIESNSQSEENKLKKLSRLASKKISIAEDVESALRSRIRRILLGS